MKKFLAFKVGRFRWDPFSGYASVLVVKCEYLYFTRCPNEMSVFTVWCVCVVFSLLKSFVILLVVFSACGGIRTGSKLLVLTAYFPVLAKGILGKCGLFVEDWVARLTGSSTRAGTGCR